MGFAENVVRDIGYAVRILRRSPGFATAAVLTLAIGIGANTAVFSLLDALVLRTLPVPNPEQLVILGSSNLGYPHFVKLRERATMFSGISAIWTLGRSNLIVNRPRGGGGFAEPEPGQIRIGLASAEYFSTLRVKPAIGRTFAPDEELVPGGHPVAVISHAYWERRFARRPDILAHTLSLNGITYDIVGVTSPGFSGEWVGVPTDVWVPIMMASQVMPEFTGGPDRSPARVIARVRPELTIEQAEAGAQLAYRQILKDEAGVGLSAQRLEQIDRVRLDLETAANGYSPQRASLEQPLRILMIAVGLLLLVGCANLANLMLSRASSRQRELAVRRAIGASRGRLARQMLTESALVALAGGALGIVFASWGATVLAAMVSAGPVSMSGGEGTSPFLDVRLDARVIAFTTALSMLTAVLCGIGPALSGSGVAPYSALMASGARLTRGGWRLGPTRVLVIVQVAVSLVLLIGSGLFLRTLENLRSESLGFERDDLLFVWTTPGQTGRQDTAVANLWHAVQERLAALPGVLSVGATNQAILSGFLFVPRGTAIGMTIDGEPPSQPAFGASGPSSRRDSSRRLGSRLLRVATLRNATRKRHRAW